MTTKRRILVCTSGYLVVKIKARNMIHDVQDDQHEQEIQHDQLAEDLQDEVIRKIIEATRTANWRNMWRPSKLSSLALLARKNVSEIGDG